LPSRRRYIPKADGRQRPLGIAAIEDKIVQAAVVAILTPIYEAEFLGFSYGFRPGRSQHNALDALAYGIGARKIDWIIDADVRSFFDTISQDWLIQFLEQTLLVREPGDLAADRWWCAPSVRAGKAKGPKPAMNGGESSDPTIVAMKSANESRRRVKERVEPRVGAKGNALHCQKNLRRRRRGANQSHRPTKGQSAHSVERRRHRLRCEAPGQHRRLGRQNAQPA
jgi:hypothetical protein